MRFFITGGCGFLGSNLASEVIKRGHELCIFDNLYRFGSEQNLKWLQNQGKFKFYRSDIRSYNDVEYAILDFKPDFIFHLAGQVAMTTSLENPRLDFEINVLGGINLLECARKYVPNAVITYSSTNKVYGDFDWIQFRETNTRYVAEGFALGFDEKIPLNFQSPYGCSKGSVDQYMLDYSKMFGLNTIVFRHSSIFGGRQFSTIDQGWVGWFVNQAIRQKRSLSYPNFTVSGSGKQVRDIVFISDLIDCYFSAISKPNICKGQVYNIGGGMINSLSILELFDILEKELDMSIRYALIDERKSDQKVFVADISKAKKDFGFEPKTSKNLGILKMISWMNEINL